MKSPIALITGFCRNTFGRKQSTQTKGLKSSSRRPFRLEPMESRLLLSADLVGGIPDWADEGPGPENNGAAVSIPDTANGATEVLLAHPTIANMAFAGTVAGGVWRTSDITGGGNPANIVWDPLTDILPSLYVGAMAFDPSSPNTLYVGTGSYSNTFRNQLPEMARGLYRTTNANAPANEVAWENIGAAVFANQPIRRIAISPSDPQLIFVASDDGAGTANGGLFRSNTGTNGQQWTELSDNVILPFTGGASDVVRDPNRNNTYYVAAPGVGVFRTDNNGDNWTRIDNLNTAITGIGGSTNIEISLHDAGATTVVYVGVIDSTGVLSGVFRYAEDGVDNNGLGGIDDAGESTWTIIAGTPAIHGGKQGFNNFSIAADPANANLVYVGGDRPPHIFRGDAGANNWTSITSTLAVTGTAPHADSRYLGFLNNTTLIETDDGGIYRLTNPASPTTLVDFWASLNGNLRAFEFHAVAYDTAANLIFGGAQDNGSAVQSGVNSPTWSLFQGGDGSTQAYSVPGNIRYALGNNYGSFTRNGTQLQLRAPAGVANFDGLENVTGSNSDQAFATGPNFESRLPIDANRFNANDVMFGRRALYESTNQGDNITIVIAPTAFAKAAGERFVSLVYGGVRAATNFANVFWAGTESGSLYIRDESGTITDRTAALAGVIAGTGAIHDIAIDPDDYRRAFVLKGDRVAFTINSGANWTEITDNIGTLTTELRSLALVDETPGTAGDGILLAGGLGGVFRRLPSFSTTRTWSEFGIMPNSLVQDLDFVPVDPDGDATDGIGILLAGTFGRGAQLISDATALIDVPGVLQIFGDENGFAEDDTIRLIREASLPNILDVFINSVTPVLKVELSVLQQINVYGLGGNDTLIMDSSNGLIDVLFGTRYDGGPGNDQLQLLQTGGAPRMNDTYSVGPDIGAGKSTIVGTGTDGTQIVFFEHLEPVLDLVPAGSLIINATPADNAINYSAGGGATGFVTIDEHESITFANKTSLTIAAGSGIDTIGINSAVTPTGLTGITIDGGDPTDGDTLIVTGVGVAVSVNTATGSITGATGLGGVVPITYSAIESLRLPSGIGDLTITTTAADDTATVTPGLSTGANSGSVASSGAVPQISFVNSGTFTANLGAGSDALVVNGSSNADTIAVSAAAVAITGRRTVNATGEEYLRVNGQGGSDTFNVTPSATVGIFIDGGDPVGAIPGDLLNILAGGGSVTYNAGPETDEGSFVVGVNQPVSFDHIESVGVTGSGPVVINGTNGPDTITVIARDASTNPGTNGVQDFTVSVNTGPDLLFINVATLTINALSGSDQVTLQTPAPNNAVWDVDVTVNGGVPADDTDRLIVQTPGGAAETALFTPTADDGGTLDLTSLSSLITITGTEALSYSGMGDNDGLTIVGTGGNDVFVHTPGATDQAGRIQVNGLLALNYLTLGSAGSLTVSGGAGTDTLVVNGTAANDSFTVGAAGQVNLNSRVVLNVSSIETLTLEGLDGDDVFTLVPAISASVYTTMNFNGGTQASATGDRTNLIATGGDDNLVISGQAVSLGGKTVQSSGVEDIRLDALAGNDLITYNGVSGITENIVVSSSGFAGGGQISAPGVTLVNFSGVERIDVNGNTPTPTETDTLTFAGTNAVDTFDINLAADGTDVDPILKLSDASSALLLTLRNYTNFATLNVLGLDGEDTFNVTVDATGPSRNLFIDGGAPTGKKKSTDNLNVFYVPPRPSIIHSAATQDPDAGLVDLDYDTARFLVQYDDIEQVVIRRT